MTTLADILHPHIAPPSRWADCVRHAAGCIPQDIAPIIEWADTHYRVLNDDCEFYDSRRSPWNNEPLLMCDDPYVNAITFVKPIQSGGTSVGEIVILRHILAGHGLIGYYWPTNDKAKDRWNKWTERRLKACHAVRAMLPTVYEDCFVKFPNVTFAMQGVFTSGNLDSDTVDLVVCEEVHQWEPGMLGKAKGRQTRVTFPKLVVISNGGLKGDQLHQQFNDGTQQQFEVKCPGCGKFHVMRTQWDDRRPELGGLRYDSENCKRSDGTFDYNKLLPTLRYQFPCGYEMGDDVRQRREAAQNGRYSEPFNTGALLSNRSYTLQAVACHDIRWLDLVQEKHQALRSLKTGDDKDWRRFLQERECQFYSPDSRPFEGQIVVNTAVKKNREGLKDRFTRLAMFDWQQGYKHKGQLIHYWGVIEDVLADMNSMVVWEGMVTSESELLALLAEYTVEPGCVAIDASKNTKSILQFCYQNGFNAVMGNASHVGQFRDHDDRVPRYYSAGKPIHPELNVAPLYEYVYARNAATGDVVQVPDRREPLVIMFNLGGLLANHFFCRELKQRVIANCAEENPPRVPAPHEYFERIIPGDVSEEFQKHHAAWERVGRDAKQKAGDIKSQTAEAFRHVTPDDHLMMCLAYADLFKDWSGILGEALTNLGIQPATETKTNETK